MTCIAVNPLGKPCVAGMVRPSEAVAGRRDALDSDPAASHWRSRSTAHPPSALGRQRHQHVVTADNNFVASRTTPALRIRLVGRSHDNADGESNFFAQHPALANYIEVTADGRGRRYRELVDKDHPPNKTQLAVLR
jgi:hypothetical protein